MALLSGLNVCDTVAFRIANRLPANGTGAGSIIECANQALGLISSSGSWVWDLAIAVGLNLTSDLAIVSNCDSGKEIACFNLANGTRIEKAKTSNLLSASTGYVNTSSTLYNTFYVNTSGGTVQDPVLTFYPPQGNSGGAFVSAVYHLIPPVLFYVAGSNVRWTVTAMDQLLIDLTEAIVKRVLGMAGWDVMYADCVKRIGEFRVTYSSQRENTGPDAESDISAKEKQTGRD